MPSDTDKRFQRIERRLDDIETQLGLMPARTDKKTAVVAPAKTAPSKSEPSDGSAGFRVFGFVGFGLILLALFYFYRYAVDHGWLGIPARVALGTLFSLIVIGAGELFRARGHRKYSQLLTGGGVALLYFTAIAAYHFPTYHAVLQTPLGLHILILLVIAAIGTWLALRDDAPLLGGILLAIGFIATLLTGGSHIAVMAGFVLAAGAIILTARKDWPFGIGAALGVYILLAAFFSESGLYTRITPDMGWAFLYATIAYLAFLLASLWTRDTAQATVTVALNAALGLFLLLPLVSEHWPSWKGPLVIAFAALNLAMMPLARREHTEVYRACAIALALIAVPVILSNAWITAAWALLGLALFIIGLRIDAITVRILGYVGLGLASIRVLFWDSFQLTFPDRTVAAVIVVAVLWIAAVWPRPKQSKSSHLEATHTFFLIAASIVTTVVLGREILDGQGLFSALELGGRQILLSITWAITSVGLLIIGIRDDRTMRYLGFALFGLAIGKILIVDLSGIDTVYRIIVTFVVGIIALTGAFYFIRHQDQLENLLGR